MERKYFLTSRILKVHQQGVDWERGSGWCPICETIGFSFWEETQDKGWRKVRQGVQRWRDLWEESAHIEVKENFRDTA